VARITPTGGSYVPLEFSFGDAGTSPTVQAPVVPPTQTTAVASPVPTDIATPPPAEGQESDGSN
jgi:hypothetical protein